jgi:hypothetical protein
MKSHQIRDRRGGHLAHETSPMGLDGNFADAQPAADLLVQQTGGDEVHHLTLAIGEQALAIA